MKPTNEPKNLFSKSHYPCGSWRILLIFFLRSFNSDGSFSDNFLASSTKNVSYHEIKQLISNNEVENVSIGQTLIKASHKEGNNRVIYIAKRVPDLTLVPLLDEKKSIILVLASLTFYGHVRVAHAYFSDFRAMDVYGKPHAKNMGGGIFGMGSAKNSLTLKNPMCVLMTWQAMKKPKKKW